MRINFETLRKGGGRHRFYTDTVALAEAINVHANGVYPKALVECRRPHEPLEVKEYREKIWAAKTKPTFTKILSSLQKIRRSSEWVINYPTLTGFSRVAIGEGLNDYCEHDLPYFQSVTNWVFQVMLRHYLIDANGGVLVMPISADNGDENEYLKPFLKVYNSGNIIDYKVGEYVILLEQEGAIYYINKEAVKGASYVELTTTHFIRYNQVNRRGDVAIAEQYEHGLGLLPFVFWGGLLIESTGANTLFESRIAGIVPELDEALREYSDLQAAKVLHIYPERWEFTQSECQSCKGRGQLYDAVKNCDTPCDTCGGVGVVGASPYSKILVRPITALDGGGAIPTPPAGYVEKDVEIVKVMEESVERHIYNALAAINFEFLAQSPSVQSGIAKAEDRDEANNMVNAIAEDIVAAMDMLYKIIARYRYGVQYSAEEIDKMLPYIAVPEKFDIVSLQGISATLKDAKDTGISPIVRGSIELDYCKKLFSSDPNKYEYIRAIIELDPLTGVSEDDKMSRLSNGGIDKLTYVISSNIVAFLNAQILANAQFLTLSRAAQFEALKEAANAFVEQNKTIITPIYNGE